MIVGASLFLGLSIPAYVQQYQPQSSLILPGYFVPYAAASDGPVHSGSREVSNLYLPFFISINSSVWSLFTSLAVHLLFI